MSEFVKRMFVEKGRHKPILEKLPNINELNMECMEEAVCVPKRLIEYTFKALWTMRASGTAEEYNQVHKIAVKALKRAIYEDFFTQLTHLELAIFDYDVEKAKKIIHEIKEEIDL